MAEVWKARTLGPMGYARTLVVKRILPELACDEEFVRMFVEEARLSASLNHRNIVQVYEFGDVGGEFYLAMEWVHGRDLNTLLKALNGRSAAPPLELAAYVTREVCRALAYAHALTDEDGQPLRLIHRDVSPSNVMLGYDGSVKLLDFGIAKALALASENRTQVGVLKGKFGYMAPEQVDLDADVDHRADLFVAGVVLWEMLTLRRLFKGANDVQTIGMVRAARALPPSAINPAVPPELEAVCMRALARERSERFADCGEMAAALDEIVHRRKFGADGAARLMRAEFPGEREPTQPMATVTAEPTPSRQAGTPTPAGVRVSAKAHAAADARPIASSSSRPAVDPSAPTRLRRVFVSLAPALRRRDVLVAAAGVLALAGVIAVKRPAPPSPAPVHAAAPMPVVTPLVMPPGAPATVRIRLTTKPAGAEVTVEGETTARGTTPLVLTLPRGQDVRRLFLKAPGYARAVAEVTPDLDSRLHFELERATVRRRAPRKLKPTTPPEPDLTLPAVKGFRDDDEP
jgi:serine/threonine protein kinase